MEIIEPNNVYQEHVRVRNTSSRGVIPRHTIQEVDGLSWNAFRRDMFSRNHNPLALMRNNYELNRGRWIVSHGVKPTGINRFRLLMKTSNPFTLMRANYRDNYARELTKWERERVTDINFELTHLGNMPLHEGGSHSLKILRSLDRMLNNLKYEGGPDLDIERNLTDMYRYIFACPHDSQFANLTPGLLCQRLRECGVPEKELPIQDFEGLLKGLETSTYMLVPLSEGKAYVRRPVLRITLNTNAAGSFPVSIQEPIPQQIPPRHADKSQTVKTKSVKPKKNARAKKRTVATAKV